MKKLSTGDDSTLGNYKKLASIFFGENSPQVRYLERKIEETGNGENEEVIADETQMIHFLTSLTN